MKALLITINIIISTTFNVIGQEGLRPISGPGSSNYNHESVITINGGNQAGDFIIYLPSTPTPRKANVVAFLHGIFQTNPVIVGQMIDHLVKKGNIVIFSRYHKNEIIPTENYMLNKGARGIKDALQYLEEHKELPQPIDGNFALIGHSFGATMVAHYAAKYEKFGLPKPKAVLPIQPGVIPIISLEDYSEIKEDTKLLSIISNNDILTGTAEGNRIFNTGPKTEFNNLVTLRKDDIGPNGIVAGHEAPLANNDDYNTHDDSPGTIAAYLVAKENQADYYCFWKLAEALLDCAFEDTNCEYAFGNTYEQRYMGTWENGRAIRELKVYTHDITTLNNDATNVLKTSVYPNPFSEYLMIDNQSNWINSISIYSSNGVLVYEDNAPENSTIKVDLKSNFTSGSYIIQLAGENTSIIKKVIKL